MAITPGYTAHWDASTTERLWENTNMTGTPDDGDTVLAWDDVGDATGVALFDNPGAGTGPVYRAAAFNGLGCLDFNGTDQFLNAYDDAYTPTAQALSVFLGAGQFKTIFVSFILEGDATNQADTWVNTAILADSTPGDPEFGLLVKTSGGVNTLMAFNWGSGVGDSHADVTIVQDTNYVAMLRHDDTTIYLSVNGGAESSDATGQTTDMGGHFCVGKGLGSSYFPGKIGEIVLYDTLLSGTDLTDTYEFLMNKWVTSLRRFLLVR